MVRFGYAIALVLATFLVMGCCKLPLPSAKGDKTFVVNHPCDNSPGLTVTKIVLTPTETRVHCKYQNLEKNSVTIATAPPGQADTFFIEASDQMRRHGLTRSSGIAVSPKRDSVPPGAAREFTLYFPAIEQSWGPIDLHEGEVVKKGENYWNFTDIPLK